MDLQLTGKRALVTGSTDGTGVAIAHLLAAEGAHVIVHGRDADKAAQVVAAIRAAGGRADAVLGDLSTQAGADRVAREARHHLGGLDILVNNAALIGHYETWDDTDDAAWGTMYDGVVVVVQRLVKALLPHFDGAGWGRIVNIASAQSGQPFGMMPDYAAAKCAVLNLTVSLSKRLSKRGVNVNVVSPGIIVTDTIRQRMTEAARKEGRSTEWSAIEQHVLATELDNTVGRLAKPEDVAAAVAFLCSPLADYINGTNLRVDGGSNVTINP